MCHNGQRKCSRLQWAATTGLLNKMHQELIKNNLVSHKIICALKIKVALSARHITIGRDKSRTGSTWIADLNKNSTYSRTRKCTIVLFLFKSAIRVDPVRLLSMPYHNCYMVESRFLEPPGETKIGSSNLGQNLQRSSIQGK